MKKNKVLMGFEIVLGVLLIALGYYFFFLPEDLVTGGVTGIVIIMNKILDYYWFSPSFLILCLNIILMFMGLLFVGKSFFIKTAIASVLLPFFTGIFEFTGVKPDFILTLDEAFFAGDPMNATSRIIIATIMGSLLTGVGLGLCFRCNSSTGGMDVIQKICAKIFHLPYSKTIYLTDGIIVIGSLFVFGIEKTFFGLLGILIIGLVLDFVSMGGKSRRTAFIITKKSEEVKDYIISNMGRGVTVVDARGGFSNEDFEMLICTLSKNESYKLKDIINEVDKDAFTFYVSAKEVYGDGFE